MKWLFRIMVVLTVLILAGVTAFGIFCVVYKTMVNNYRVRVTISMDAAQLSGDGVAVQADGQWRRLNDEACTKLRYYITRDPLVWTDWFCAGRESISLRFSEDPVTLWKLSPDAAVVRLDGAGGGMTMRVRADGIWDRLTLYTGVKYYHTDGNE